MRFFFWVCFSMFFNYAAVNGRRNGYNRSISALIASVDKCSSQIYRLVSESETTNVATSPLGFGLVLFSFDINWSITLLDEMESFLCIHKDFIIEDYNRLKLILNESGLNISYDMISHTSLRWIEPVNKIQATSRVDVLFKKYVVNMNFNVKWKEPFSEYSTIQKPFFTVDKNYSVPTMNVESYFTYGNISNVKASFIELPYQNNVYMLIVLPDEIDGLDEVERALFRLTVQEIKQNNIRSHVDVELPKFKIEITTNLSAAFERTNSITSLQKNNLAQTAFIEVAETGLTTDYENDGQSFFSVSLANAFRFQINRPFHYKIVQHVPDSDHDLIIFVGNVKSF